jgi:RNA polymerase sigma factor (sigma-70 family)
MENNSINLRECVRQAKNGDIGSYEQIVKRFQAFAFSQAFSRLGDSHLAEDAVQDAFLEAYLKLGSLRTPEAFATWFRRIVLTACTRITRRISIKAASLEEVEREAETIADPDENPAEQLERKEREKAVHLAVQNLPDNLRMVTALYYIGGIGQKGIAGYLSLSETTVKKRLFTARKKLKEDITNMAKKIADNKMPAEQVSARVIAELVSRPQPLLIGNHPMRQIVEQIKAALPDYEMIESSEVEERAIYPSIQKDFIIEATTYQLDAKHILRTQTSGATLRAIKGRKSPIRLLTAGRVFRMEKEDERHLKVFHQLDGICVVAGASQSELQKTVKKLVAAVLGTVDIRFRDIDFKWVDDGTEVEVKENDKWISVAGCGMLKSEMLREAGHDPDKVSGYAFGVGLERLATMKLGLKTVQELWRPPYVKAGS